MTQDIQEEKIGAVELRQAKQKELFIDLLKKTPIVQIVCEKVDVSRTTYYRWHKADTEFAEAADMALEDGAGLINDMAESQLITAIRDGNLTAVMYLLKSHHKSYANRVELALDTKPSEALTPEQEEIVRKALTLASLIEPVSSDINPDIPLTEQL
jgi:predicted DNA binding protein